MKNNKAYKQIEIIELTPVEKIWLSAVYAHLKENKKVTYRQLRAELQGKIPGFKKSDINKRLVKYGVDHISLLGIIALDGNYSVLEKADRIIHAIKKVLIANPLKDSFTVKELSKITKLPETEVGYIFETVSHYGRFYSTASSQGIGTGYTDFGIGSDDELYDQYMEFDNIADVIVKDERRDVTTSRYALSEARIEEDKKVKAVELAPVFHSNIVGVNHTRGFVLMPFVERWSEKVYRRIIRDNIESLHLECNRADNLNGAIIMEDIWVSINNAAFIIADVTGKNPNVMYELGIAHTLAKPTIMITQDLDDIPFDCRHLRHLKYKNELDGEKDFKDRFCNMIRDIYSKHYPEVNL